MATTTTNTSNNAASFNIDQLIARNVSSKLDETTINKTPTGIPQVQHDDRIEITSPDGNANGKLFNQPMPTTATPIITNPLLDGNYLRQGLNPATSAAVNKIPFLNNTLDFPYSITGKIYSKSTSKTLITEIILLINSHF